VGILEPLKLNINNCHEHEAGTKHYISPNGMSSLVKYFLNKYECEPEFEHHITSVTRINEKWYFIANKCRNSRIQLYIGYIPFYY
jgi:predicted NAD/FAD-dependent oxidoreductase